MTTLTEVAGHPLLRSRFGLLATAAGEVASPQIRNQGTLGGNASQDTRCWYYRGGFDCYRAGGNLCYADTPEGMQGVAAQLRSHFKVGMRVGLSTAQLKSLIGVLEVQVGQQEAASALAILDNVLDGKNK